MNIVYFGTDVFINVFRYFNKQHHILALYTYHNDEDYFTEYSIVQEARESGISVHYEEITVEKIKEYMEKGCELFFIAEYSHIIPIPKETKYFRAINVHSSLLPEGRSYYPIEDAMKQGMHETGVTMHSLSERVDSGDILLQQKISILPTDDSIDIYLKCASEALRMTEKLFEDFEGKWKHMKRQGNIRPYWKRPKEEELLISHEMTRLEAEYIFKCYNKMSKVKIGKQLYYVSFLTTKATLVLNDIQWLSKNRVLFKLADGHMRIEIQAVSKGAE